VELAPSDPGKLNAGTTDPDEAAWRTAVEAAPRLVGESEPQEQLPAEELYSKLTPFKEQLADHIRESDAGDGD
jgi:hypothetical protein